MRSTESPSPVVVAGIDGSHNSVVAALWAAEEAADRGAHLRLAYAVEPREAHMPDPRRDAGDLSGAEIAVRTAIASVQSRGLPIKIEVEIRQQPALLALRELSQSAALICIGHVGNSLATGSPLGSVATELAMTVQCTVAIIRGNDPGGAILVESDSLIDNDGLIESGVHEALLRSAPLVVATATPPRARQSWAGDLDKAGPDSAQLESRLCYWRRRYPRLRVDAVSIQRNFLEHVAQHAQQLQLVVVGRRRSNGLAELLGTEANRALHGTNCSLLVHSEHGAL